MSLAFKFPLVIGPVERYVSAALHLGLLAERQGDRFGIITYTDRPRRFLRASNGRAHFRACRETVYDIQPARVQPDFREIFTGMHANLQRRSLLVFFTALDDPLLAESFEREITVLSRRHVVLVFSLETTSTRPLFAGPPPATLGEAYAGVAGQMLWNRLRTLAIRLRNRGVSLHVVYAFLSLKAGRFPEWDWTIYCGQTFVGNIQAALFYPPIWLLFAVNIARPHVSYQSLQVFVIAHVWLAFLLCYVWLTGRQLKPLAGVLGAGVYAYSGYMLLQLQHSGLIAGYAWFPLGFWLNHAPRRPAPLGRC